MWVSAQIQQSGQPSLWLSWLTGMVLGAEHETPVRHCEPLPMGFNLPKRKIMKQFPLGVEAIGCEAWRLL